MVDNSQTPALGVMTVVHSRDAATLLPIIQQHGRPPGATNGQPTIVYSISAQLIVLATPPYDWLRFAYVVISRSELAEGLVRLL